MYVYKLDIVIVNISNINDLQVGCVVLDIIYDILGFFLSALFMT